MATPTSLPATFVAGNVLTAAQMNDLRGAFRILQVVRATDTTLRTTTSTSLVDVTGMSVTITPTDATSTILIIADFLAEVAGSGSVNGEFQITDSSNTAISGAEGGLFYGDSLSAIGSYLQRIAYDSPATTSATTYKLRFRKTGGATIVACRNQVSTGQMYALEISA